MRFARTARLARRSQLLSHDHFGVDGTLGAARASQKSVRRRDGQDDDNPDGPGRNAGRNFHGEQQTTPMPRAPIPLARFEIVMSAYNPLRIGNLLFSTLSQRDRIRDQAQATDAMH